MHDLSTFQLGTGHMQCLLGPLSTSQLRTNNMHWLHFHPHPSHFLCVCRVFVFQFQGHRGQAPSFITGPTDVRLKRAAYLSRSCILEHTSHFLSRHIFQLRIPRMCRRWVPSSPSVYLIKKNQKSNKKKRNFLKINQKINGSCLALL